MPGEDSDLLGRIMLALSTLGAAIGVDHAASSKQHGLPRPRVANNA
jgi:hypothetical protein